jgi:hypothetical protein
VKSGVGEQIFTFSVVGIVKRAATNRGYNKNVIKQDKDKDVFIAVQSVCGERPPR